MFARIRPSASALLARQPSRLVSTRIQQSMPFTSTRSVSSSTTDASSYQARPSAIARSLAAYDDTTSVMKMFRLDGKVIPVTGGARGLGLTMAVGAIEAGAAHVYCLDVLPEPSSDFFAAQMRLADMYDGQLRYVRIDVTNAEDVNNVISEIGDRHQRLDGCIAAAGIQYVREFLDYPAKEITRMMATNYNGVFLSAQACARQMVKYNTPGSLVLVASMSGAVANKGLHYAVYNSSKAAVVQLARNMSMELAPIRVNSISPGNVLTPMVEKNFADQPGLHETWEAGNMLGRISTVDEFKGPAVFLLSNASTFMTAGELRVDGGYTAW